MCSVVSTCVTSCIGCGPCHSQRNRRLRMQGPPPPHSTLRRRHFFSAALDRPSELSQRALTPHVRPKALRHTSQPAYLRPRPTGTAVDLEVSNQKQGAH